MRKTRGQPLLVFAVILGAWLVGRVLLWQSPFPLLAKVPGHGLVASGAATGKGPGHGQAGTSRGKQTGTTNGEAARSPLAPVANTPYLPALRVDVTPATFAPMAVDEAAGHSMLLAAAFSHMALPPEIARLYGRREAAAGLAAAPVADRPLLGSAPAKRPAASRWSGDGWLLWRDGSGQAVAPGVASYGRSQAGAVVRYDLARGGRRPQVYARVTRSVEGPRQAELAAGLSVRPVAALPVRVAAEARVTDTAAGREVRPAAFAVTELPPADLPLGLQAEGYAQAGYVGGTFATAFVDGQARVDHAVARFGDDEGLRAGLAAWGGAQKGAARLDVGPSAALALKIGDVRSRLAVDYRVRVAGSAAPESGPALTFSAGF